MVKSYINEYFGTPAAVEAAVRMFDKVFRARYNVYGGHREATFQNADGEYVVQMSYTADWTEGEMLRLFPEYSIKSIQKTFWEKMHRSPLDFEFSDWGVREIPSLEAWRSGKC